MMKLKNNFLILLFLFLGNQAFCQTEAELTKQIAGKYGSEYPIKSLEDGTIPDLVNTFTAFEVDFYNKWYEGVGQAQHYARKTGKKPALILLVSLPVSEYKLRKISDASWVCGKNNIDLYIEFYNVSSP